MRPWGNALAALLVTAATAAAAQAVVPQAGLPSMPSAAGTDRPVIRGTDGSAQGFGDGGVSRGSAGRAGGLVLPDASGGATARATDGRVQGTVPPPADLPTYAPTRRTP